MDENEHGYIQYQHTETELHDTTAVHLVRRSQQRGRTVVVHTGMDCLSLMLRFQPCQQWSSYMYHVVYDVLQYAAVGNGRALVTPPDELGILETVVYMKSRTMPAVERLYCCRVW